jgi:MCP family monocarboxylic acid transporter-like MFS transporter 10
MGVISHWFKRRQGLALGFVTAGASIGGTVLPIVIRNLIKNVGYAFNRVDNVASLTVCTTRFHWTMRILGLILLVVLGFANLACFSCVALHISES